VELGRTPVGADRAARSDGEFEAVRDAWRALAGQARYFFQTPAWIEPFAARSGPDVAWRALVADDGRPAAVSVLSRSVRRAGGLGINLLSPVRVGEGQMPYADCLLDREAFGERSLRDLANAFGAWHVLWLTGMRARSPWLEVAGEHDLVREEPDEGAGIFDTRRGVEECWHTASKGMRHSVHNARHRIAARGGGEVAVATGSALGAAYDRHVALEAAGWKGRAGVALSDRPFERELLREHLAAEPTAQVRSLMINGQAAATQIATTVARTLFLRHIAYDESLASLSPGNVLMADLLERCCEDPGLDRIDFLAWQPWFPRWGIEREPTYSVVAFNPRTVRGVAARAIRGTWERLDARPERRAPRARGSASPARSPRGSGRQVRA